MFQHLIFLLKDARRRTIYEYHRVEIDTTKIVTRSAFEFIPLPSEYAPWNDHSHDTQTLPRYSLSPPQAQDTFTWICFSYSLSSTHKLWSLPNIQPDGRLWLVQHDPAVRWNSQSSVWKIIEAIECMHPLSLITIRLCSRCSDGIDRHRQEWLDYNCPEEVGYLNIRLRGEKSSALALYFSKYSLSSEMFVSFILIGKGYVWGLRPWGSWGIYGVLQPLFP